MTTFPPWLFEPLHGVALRRAMLAVRDSYELNRILALKRIGFIDVGPKDKVTVTVNHSADGTNTVYHYPPGSLTGRKFKGTVDGKPIRGRHRA